MAFPAVATVNYSEETVGTTTHDVLLPTGISAGDLLLLFMGIDGNPTISGMPGGWNNIMSATTTTLRGEAWYKFAVGGESDFAYTSSARERSVNRTWRVTGAHASSAPEFSATQPTGSATSANFPTATPSWGAEDSLWVCFAALDGSISATGYPTNFTDNQFTDESGGGVDGAGVGICSQNLNAASLNPDSMTFSASSDFAIRTFVIRPAAVAADAPTLRTVATPLRW